MEFLQTLFDEIIGFLGISQALEILRSGDFSSFTTYEGIVSLIYPIIPLLIILELILGLIYKKPQTKVYKVNFLIYVFNRFIGRFIAIAMVALCIGLFQQYAPFQTTMKWYWIVYGYVVWELGHFVYHYLGHKVRLFWCLHSTHHAPEDMNLSVTHAHFFLEAPYADTIRTTICILLGVHPELLFLIMFIDGTYGAFIHVGENLLKNGRLGFLNKIILTPSHHRVHHAKNPLYMDTNFCNLLNIWDRVFKTYQEEKHDIKIEYGITREMDSGNFMDVYFGEIVALAKDVWRAPGLANKFLYLIMPPGWNHTGEHKTAKVARKSYLESM
ncbi:sterol desaturase family protein [Flagellimonas taeanensis]|jgi:sterol desaturase/sphingolipid hydroxylase (fatty acid hydroxylase superfamily)|uniref:Sterol desaturase/sphingolipid hydroxylase, fatty acid hydroxylase superfamily n=1 Tax=Flagellimonas taeanensis TaxID=1005926 RepID=A0A1M6ZPN0_9FLAO|nr:MULTISPECIES: sterol desaturase family protein [Allomuricauda]MDC6386331.1 sterol desaturase family protein [Muricauda sp. SK9]MEE1963493.1 sterol desaturase family protein [Allomuricauda taeanensis]RIV47995.1 sterol desaturase family protein [Allomuricauda taeanensis]SFC29768.1 Sterol desaturase/sphingolipid hydroxylase, fatty acid hydroxylase superfamily [Allomuricauda taeanensis]SHL32394.1 Sterol desaturase/sphingolipid hydroxylase, fatty acid hydroxylase superfamily [Allomuricauda taean